MQYKTILALSASTLFVACEAPPSSQSNEVEVITTATSSNTATLWVNGIGCPGCIPSVEEPMMKLSGVTGVSVALQTGVVTVNLDPNTPASEEQLAGAIEDGGFTLTKIEMPQ
jgi:copper chaperone CopZ